MRHDYHNVSIFHYRTLSSHHIIKFEDYIYYYNDTRDELEIRTNKVPFLHYFLRHPIKDNYYETLLFTFSSPLLVDNKFFL